MPVALISFEGLIGIYPDQSYGENQTPTNLSGQILRPRCSGSPGQQRADHVGLKTRVR